VSTKEQVKAELTARQETERARLEQQHLQERANLERRPEDGKVRRTVYRYLIEVAPGETNDIPRTFVVGEVTEHQVQDKRARFGWVRESSSYCEVTQPIGRQALVRLLESGASALSYLGENESS
jgi:hypothetical protein